MKLSVLIASRPVTVVIPLALLVLLPPSLVITRWYKTTRQIGENVDLNTQNLHSGFLSQIDTIAKAKPPLSSSAANLVMFLSSSFNKTDGISFTDIENKVAPSLFLAFSTIPNLSQISYVGSEGLFFPIILMDIKLYQHMLTLRLLRTESAGFEQHCMIHGDILLSKTGGKVLVNFRFLPVLACLEEGGSLSLITMDGKLMVDGIPNSKFISVNRSIVLRIMNPSGAQNVSCTTPEIHILYIGEKEYSVTCSAVDIAGVQSVCICIGITSKRTSKPCAQQINHSHIALLAAILFLLIALVFFISSMGSAAQREMCLHDKLIKQMEATQQAERKSMNKSLALVGASHDIRASLAGINGFIDLCLTNAAPGKIEAGMMNLEEQEFNLAELVEHVVDLYHHVGMIKGVDVVLDPCDGSIIKLTQVKGDGGKLMQILSNVLSNSVKFTAEGHVCLRAWVRKPDFEMLASNRKGFHKYLSYLFNNKNEASGNAKGISAVRQIPDSVEIVFEVDDTCKGIPQENQKSVFENHVQVKETAAGQVDTGLGLGIVQSLVRLMGGEIRIDDNGIGEKGTCFRFNQQFKRKSDMSGRSDNFSLSSKDMPLSAMDGNDLKLPLNRRRDALSFILLVIDVNAGQFFELWRIVAEFRRGLQSTCCKVVWLDKPTARMINPIRLDPGDEFLLQPFHGSRLHRVIKLLPEFGAASSQGVSGNPESSKHAYNKARLRNSQHSVEILEYGSSSDERYSKKRSSSSPSLVRTHGMVTSKISPIRRHDADSSTGKPLFGKRILIAEDNKMLSFIATTTVRQLGADVENCVNGNEAVELMFPLDGYEATRLIRTEEEKYGVHIPIIVLTAHTDGEEAVETGMDAHLVKPLKSEELMEVIENIQRKSNG
ncbi:Detected protein of unknown function [Hibiscus syriacus]|uniref:histidine kinase n=2 Tax=Hibiscus syriacus TaxID=106335 RepID=A0A6A3AG89_HIBSY|nr:Detected protein of unknown function [Hibiscus syriacus]